MSRFDVISLERDVEDFETFRFVREHIVDESEQGNGLKFVSGVCTMPHGRPKVDEKSLLVEYSGGTDIRGFDVRLMLNSGRLSSGVGAVVCLRGWDSLASISIGYTKNNVVTSIKVRKIALDHWFFIEFDHADVVFQLTNSWERKDPTHVDDIRIHINGRPGGAGASIEIREFYTWVQRSSLPSWLNASPASEVLPAGVMDRLWNYQENLYRLKKFFACETDCPLAYGDAVLSWPLLDSRPSSLEESVSYKFSWHAWHPVMSMLCEYRLAQDDVSLYSAQDFAAEWLHASYYGIDLDKKYCWYDHGVAERLMAMVMLYEALSQKNWSPRFLARLRGAIYRHAQLIASEAFYAYTQDFRYHNHAWFQDMSLVVAASVMKWFPCAQDWMRIAVNRLENQLHHLVEVDGDFHVLIENSMSYHNCTINILELISDLVNDSGVMSIALESTLSGMKRFSSFMRYPDGRQPSFGDTSRTPNMKEQTDADPPSLETGLTVFPNAGYAVIKGRHANAPYFIAVIASSLVITHKHEDNASFSLFFDGVEWLIDPGFHSNDYENPIPAYLRSALAHNAVAIPGVPYSLEPRLSKISGWPTGDGCQVHIYHRCYQGIEVNRMIECSLDVMDINIHDKLRVELPSEEVTAHFMFHCGEGVVATKTDDGVVLRHDLSDKKIIIRSKFGDAMISTGVISENPTMIRGIVSQGLMEISDIDVIEYKMPLSNMDMNFQISIAMD